MYAGFPVTSEKRDGKAYYRFLDTFEVGQVPFTPDELLALAFSEDLLRTLEGTVFHDSIRAALAKIRAGLGPELSRYLERFSDAFRVLPGPHKRYEAFRDTIRTLNEGVLERQTLEMRYRTGRTGEESTRRVDPYKVWYHGGALYVIGMDHRSGEIRTFAQYEREILIHALFTTGWNVKETATRLKIGRATLYRKIDRYDLRSYRHRQAG